MAVTKTIQDQVTELYVGFFGRAPDAAGMGYWAERLGAGTATVYSIANEFSKTPEFVSNYGALTPSEQIDKIYVNVLDRKPDADGKAYWLSELTKGTPIGNVVYNIVNAAFSQSGTADGLLVQNKVTVGEYFSLVLASNDTAVAKTAYVGVTSVASSVTAKEAELAQAVAPTYTLTTSIETVPASGTLPLYAQVNGVIQNGAAAGQTFQTGDTINGVVDGKNQVNVVVAAAAAAPTAVTINNVASANFKMLAADAVNAALYTNVANVGSTGGGALLTVNNGDLAATYFVKDEQTGGGANNASVGGVAVNARASQTSATNTAINFTVNNSGVRTGSVAAGFTTNNAAVTSGSTGVEIINIATAGTNYIAVTGATTVATDSATVNITGNGTNTINATALTNATVINMGTSTGTNVLNMTTNLQSLMTITGGTGADTLMTSATGVVGALNVTAVETLRLGAAAAANTTLSFAANPNFTTVRIDADADGANLKTLVNAGFTNLAYVGAGTTATSATAQLFDAFTLSTGLSGAADTVAMAVGNQGTALAAGIGYTIGALTLNGAEALNVTVADVSATGVTAIAGINSTTLGALTVTTAGSTTLGTVTAGVGGAGANLGALTSINLSGVAGTGVSTLAIGADTTTAATVITASTAGTNVTAVNADNDATDSIIFTGGAGTDTFVGTGFTGILSLTGGGGADVLTGGSNSDVIIGGEGANTLRGGLAADTINMVQTVAVTETVIFETYASTDTVTGFTAGAAAAAGDQSDLNLTALNAELVAAGGAGDTVLVGAGTSATAATAIDFSAIIGGAATFAAADNIFLINGATNADVQTIVEACSFQGAGANLHAGAGIIVAYVDGNADLHIAMATITALTGTAIDTATVADIAVLTGTYTLAGLSTDNFDFI